MSRKPIKLRWSSLSGSVFALRQYSEAGGALKVTGPNGKDDVTADFDALVLEILVPDPASDIFAILDGAADGEDLSFEQRLELREFRERLVEIAARHNSRLEAADA